MQFHDWLVPNIFASVLINEKYANILNEEFLGKQWKICENNTCGSDLDCENRWVKLGGFDRFCDELRGIYFSTIDYRFYSDLKINWGIQNILYIVDENYM